MGDMFPDGDVVARFVITLVMYANDLYRLQALLPGDEADEPEALARRLMLLRFQGSLLHEAIHFIDQAIARFAAIREFVESLPEDYSVAPTVLHDLLGDREPSLARLRNVTFHYPEMHPDRIAAGKDEVMLALDAVSAQESEVLSIEGELPGKRGTGLWFADVVVGHWFRTEYGATTAPLGAAVAVLGRFAIEAMSGQLSRQGPTAALEIEA
jgi:hypothetical protein